jgi:DNA processing protein
MQTQDALLLKSLKGIGNTTLIELIKLFRDQGMAQLSDFASVDLTRFRALKRAVKPMAELLGNAGYEISRRECENLLDEWVTAGVHLVVYGSSEYPDQLMQLEDPPAFLFCKGNLKLLSNLKAIAVVGTRENTTLGESITRQTVEYFSRRGFCIVSGLALGIDGIAHRAALAVNGATIAVVVDLVAISPSQHRGLAEQILSKGGLLVTENLPGTKSIPSLFVKRNRIQAGLALAVFAIETSVNGGTMHAVEAALVMGRDVYVPDAVAAGYPDLEVKAISGTKALISEGKAYPFTSATYPGIEQRLLKQALSLVKIRQN